MWWYVPVCEEQSKHSKDRVRLCRSAAHDWLSHYTHKQLPNQPGRGASLTFVSVSGSSDLTRKQQKTETLTLTKPTRRKNIDVCPFYDMLALFTDICCSPIVQR